jgi:hypothetical protein
VSDSVAGSLHAITFVGSSGASAADRNAFWINQLLQPEIVAILKGATLEYGELTNLDHVGRALQGAASRISGARNTDLAGQLAAATAATAAATTAAAAAASALALAATGSGAAGAGGTREAAGPVYTIHALNGQQSAEADLGNVRTNAAFVAGINYAVNGQWPLARGQLCPQDPPTQESNMILRLMSGLSEQSKVDNKLCTADRQHFQERVLVYDRLVVVKLVGLMSSDSRRSRRWRDFTGAECAAILVLVKALDPTALLSSLHLFGRASPASGPTWARFSMTLAPSCFRSMTP